MYKNFSLQKSLQELNISDNGITTLKDLHPLYNLTFLDVSNNLLSNLVDICDAVRNWRRLKTLQIDGNLISKRKRYEYEIIPVAPNLVTLSNRQINNATRIFLQALQKIRSNRQKKQKYTGTPFSSETRSFVHQLPLEFQEIVSRSIMHKRKLLQPLHC
ncbi:uncharacterized protein LOC135846635 [Planococcus citri]|uniref:uncharacterized protein LOC135846635 n=1 Tax=Planococcus citri TaxID=170843 RepID=UPI0031F88C67